LEEEDRKNDSDGEDHEVPDLHHAVSAVLVDDARERDRDEALRKGDEEPCCVKSFESEMRLSGKFKTL
jgi:hypothetical protein